jgi:hypothetical protein
MAYVVRITYKRRSLFQLHQNNNLGHHLDIVELHMNMYICRCHRLTTLGEYGCQTLPNVNIHY